MKLDGARAVKTIDPALFRETLGHYPTGVALVTAVGDDGQPIGMVVGTFSSVSLDPPLIAFLPATNSRRFARIRTAKAFCVNVLASDQESLSRQFASGGAAHLDGVRWRAGSLGSPILEDALSWLECTFEDIREAGDHFIVLGRVHELAVARSTLPLLFFQGGYGRFSPGAFVVTPDPELIQAAQMAETIRSEVEDLSEELAVNCGVLVKIGWDAVQVLAASGGALAESFPLGHRQPIIPPLGAAFLVDAPSEEVDAWLRRGPDDSAALRDLYRAKLDRVRAWGYSILAAGPELLERQQAALTAFELSDRLPRHERVLRQATADLAERFCPDLMPGELYCLASIVVPVPTRSDLRPMAIRMTSLPTPIPKDRIEFLVQRLKRVAANAGAALADSREPLAAASINSRDRKAKGQRA